MISHLTQLDRAQGAAPVRQTGAAQETALAKGQEKLSQLSDGQTVQGKVLSVSTGADGARTAQVDLGGGALVNAKLSGNMALSAGQEISFSVRNGADGGGVTLRPLYANTAADLSGMKALSQAGLPATADTTAMVREMMSEGMPIDRASLLSMTRGVMAYPGHATSVVQMTNLGIPVTGENIEQFENYKNYEHQVSKTIDAIMEELPDAFRAMNESGNRQGALDLYGELLNLFGGQEETAAAGEGQTAAVFSEELLADEETAQSGGTAEKTGVADAGDQNAARSLASHIGEQNAAAGASTADKAASSVLEAAMRALSEANAAQSDAPAKPQQFTELLRALDVPEAVIQNAQTTGAENSGQTELLRALAEAWKKTGHADERTDETWTKLFSSKEMGGLLKNAIAKDWLLKPEEAGKKENVQQLYDRLQGQTGKLAQILSGSKGAETTQLAADVRGLQNNLNFMNDLNHMFQYVQLPLKMNGGNAHGDLYVYSNKKGAMHEDGTVSAILHLDMEHMGPVDVYVKMRDNNVKTNFYLADDEMIDFLMAHIDVLNKRLEKRGYSMEAKLHTQDEDMRDADVPVKEMLSGNLSHLSMLSHTAFDALA